MDMNMGNDSDYIKRHDYLDFNKVIKSDSKLTIRTGNNIFEYLSPEGKLSSYQFNPSTSEYKILVHLIENHKNPVDTSSLIDRLNKPRRDAEGADEKQRVRDKIKAISDKLGKGLIKNTKKGYVIDCEIVRV